MISERVYASKGVFLHDTAYHLSLLFAMMNSDILVLGLADSVNIFP